MRRTRGRNARDRPLGGAGKPAECRASISRGPGCLSQAQATITSLTARRAVAREEMRQPAAVTVTRRSQSPAAMPPAPGGDGNEGKAGGESEVDSPKECATAGREDGRGLGWVRMAAGSAVSDGETDVWVRKLSSLPVRWCGRLACEEPVWPGAAGGGGM